MRRFAFGFAGTIGGYLLGAVVGYVLVMQASSNAHDRPVEAAMTGAFMTGPLGAIVFGIAGFLRGGRRG